MILNFFGNIDFVDRWNLNEHPLYIKLNKNEKNYIKIDELPFIGGYKVNSLQSIANFLREHSWVFENKYWKYISKHIQAYINLPYSDL